MTNPIVERIAVCKKQGWKVKNVAWPFQAARGSFTTLLLGDDGQTIETVTFEAENSVVASILWAQACEMVRRKGDDFPSAPFSPCFEARNAPSAGTSAGSPPV
jgi:hypothetical protein